MDGGCNHIIGLGNNECYECGGYSIVYIRDVGKMWWDSLDLEDVAWNNFCPICGEDLRDMKF